jgi:hypothetical protein
MPGSPSLQGIFSKGDTKGTKLKFWKLSICTELVTRARTSRPGAAYFGHAQWMAACDCMRCLWDAYPQEDLEEHLSFCLTQLQVPLDTTKANNGLGRLSDIQQSPLKDPPKQVGLWDHRCRQGSVQELRGRACLSVNLVLGEMFGFQEEQGTVLVGLGGQGQCQEHSSCQYKPHSPINAMQTRADLWHHAVGQRRNPHQDHSTSGRPARHWHRQAREPWRCSRGCPSSACHIHT